MLPELENAAPLNSAAARLLLVGDVDFSAPAGKSDGLMLAQTGPAIRSGMPKAWPSLDGTRPEILAVRDSFDQTHPDVAVKILRKGQATKSTVRQEAPNYSYLHFATHGFFAPEDLKSALEVPLDKSVGRVVPPPVNGSSANLPPQVVGLGASLRLEKQEIKVTEVVAGGSAALDGRLKPNDQILAVASDDGEFVPLAGKTLEDVIKLVRGPVGTQVRLRVQPVVGGDVSEYSFVRKALVMSQRTIPVPTVRQENQIAGYHPGLLSGLVLAGANLPPDPNQDNGILTALEVSSLDLSHVELVTLSACETGLGQTAGGEGLLGMQRAFQVAGARSAVATLWKVSDEASRCLMIDFYENLWEKKMSRVEALWQAQLKMLREGVHRGLAIDDQPADEQKRLPPYYWAAFELSGDWR